MSGKQIEVIRVENMDKDELIQCMEKGQVIVLTKALDRWNEVAHWTLDTFADKYQDRTLRVRGGSRMHWKTLCRVNAKEYINYLKTGDSENQELLHWNHAHPYAAFNAMTDIGENIDLAALIPDDYKNWGTMAWIGPENSMTPLHYDDSGMTLLAQITGRKKFTFFEESDSKYLYPSDVFDFMAVFSRVNIDQVDHEKYPDYAQATPTEVILNPGEIIVFPVRMWHQVQALDASMSLSCRAADVAVKSVALKHAFWYAKAILHLFGLYKKKRCLCHIVPIAKDDLIIHKPLIRFLVKLFGSYHHSHDLSDLVGWSAAGEGKQV